MSYSREMSDAGRPTLYRADYCELARNYCLLGATNEELGSFFGVTSRTVDNWIAAHREFAAAVREARAVADARVARGLYERAIGYEQTVERTVWHLGKERTVTNVVRHPPETRACIYWLRNRRRQDWSERVDAPKDDACDLALLDAAGERVRAAALQLAAADPDGNN